MVAETIRDLQRLPRHPRRASARCLNLLELDCDVLQRAHDRISVFCSNRWVAKLCRKVCGDTRLLISAASAELTRQAVELSTPRTAR
jgi:hypothetical protein